MQAWYNQCEKRYMDSPVKLTLAKVALRGSLSEGRGAQQSLDYLMR